MKLNTFQSIAVAGVCTSVASQIGLLLMGKEVANFIYVYPVWVGVFLLGTFVKMNSKSGGHHHHHHHDHDHSHHGEQS
jgi:hypothetical protein